MPYAVIVFFTAAISRREHPTAATISL